MRKKALLVYGKPNPKEDSKLFYKRCMNDIRIMREILSSQNYAFNTITFDELYNASWKNFPECSVFYYTGHGICGAIGTGEIIYLEDLFDHYSTLDKRKLFIFDSCSKKYKLPNKFNVNLIHMKEGDHFRNLAKILFDLVLCRHMDLEEINQDTFNENNYSFVRFSSGDKFNQF